MKKILAILLLATPAFGQEYVMPRIPTEEQKIEALKLGYIVNNFSMSRGSVDVSEHFVPRPPPVEAIVEAPPAPKKGKK